MIEIGKMQTLRVDSVDRSGFYLLSEANEEVFMPGTLAEDHLKVGDDVEVFIFVDKEGQEIATCQKPISEIGNFACLRVKSVTAHGAYLDLGVPRDVLVPKNLQSFDMKVGQTHLVRLCLDEKKRMFGTSQLKEYLNTKTEDLVVNKEYSLTPFYRTPLGFKVLIDSQWVGMIYHNEIFSDIQIGETYEGYLKDIQANGQINMTIRKTGFKARKSDSEKILDLLEDCGGTVALGDKSPPEEIKEALGMSKKSFKNALGQLYKNRRIKIMDREIVSIESQ